MVRVVHVKAVVMYLISAGLASTSFQPIFLGITSRNARKVLLAGHFPSAASKKIGLPSISTLLRSRTLGKSDEQGGLLYATAASRADVHPAVKRVSSGAVSALDTIATHIKNTYNVVSHRLTPTRALLLLIVGWGAVPLSHAIFKKWGAHNAELASKRFEEASNMEKLRLMLLPPSFRRKMEFEQSPLFHVAKLASQAAKIGTVLWVIDSFVALFQELGYPLSFYSGENLISVIYTVWLSARLASFKRYLLFKHMPTARGRLGRAPIRIVNQVVNGILLFLSGLFLLDLLEIKPGMALSSVFAFGGAGAIAASFAGRDIANQFMASAGLMALDVFREGEIIRLGDGTAGVVVDINWTHTTLRGETEIPVRIPNKEINNQRLSNISRVPACQIKQTLRLQYSDASKIPAFLDALKEEIRRTCPELISDGSRPFRAQLRNFEADHLAVVIDFHFANVRPGGDAYYELVQRVMQTVDEVMNSRGLTYALPTSVIREEGKGI